MNRRVILSLTVGGSILLAGLFFAKNGLTGADAGSTSGFSSLLRVFGSSGAEQAAEPGKPVAGKTRPARSVGPAAAEAAGALAEAERHGIPGRLVDPKTGKPYPGTSAEALKKLRILQQLGQEISGLGKEKNQQNKDRIAHLWAQFLAGVDAENWHDAFDSVYPIYGGGMLPREGWENFMRTIGRLAGKDGLAAFRPGDLLMDYEAYGSRYAMEGWARQDLAAATDFLKSLPDGRYKDGLAWGYFSSQAEMNRQGLRPLFDSVPEELYPQLARTLGERIRWEPPQGMPSVKLWLKAEEEQLGTDSPVYRAINQAANLDFLERAEYDPNAVLGMQTTQSIFQDLSQHSDQVVSTALRVLAITAPETALTLLSDNLATRPTLGTNTAGIVASWVKSDLGGPGDWLNQNPTHPLYNQVLEAYVPKLAKEDPAAADKWKNVPN